MMKSKGWCLGFVLMWNLGFVKGSLLLRGVMMKSKGWCLGFVLMWNLGFVKGSLLLRGVMMNSKDWCLGFVLTWNLLQHWSCSLVLLEVNKRSVSLFV